MIRSTTRSRGSGDTGHVVPVYQRFPGESRGEGNQRVVTVVCGFKCVTDDLSGTVPVNRMLIEKSRGSDYQGGVSLVCPTRPRTPQCRPWVPVSPFLLPLPPCKSPTPVVGPSRARTWWTSSATECPDCLLDFGLSSHVLPPSLWVVHWTQESVHVKVRSQRYLVTEICVGGTREGNGVRLQTQTGHR